MKGRKMIAVALCFGVLLSAFGTNLAGLAEMITEEVYQVGEPSQGIVVTGGEENGQAVPEDGINVTDESPLESPGAGTEQLPDGEPIVVIVPESTPEVVPIDPAIEQVIFDGILLPMQIVPIEMSEGDLSSGCIPINDPKYNTNGIKKPDKYNFSQSDVERLLRRGYTILDIMEADEIGNRIDFDPESLLEIKKKNGKDFTIIEKDIKLERVKGQYLKYQRKFPNEADAISATGMHEYDQYCLLVFCELNEVDSLEAVIEDYKEEGINSLIKWDKPKKTRVSKETMDELGLTEDDVAGLNDEVLEIIRQRAEIQGISVRNLLVKAKVKEGENAHEGGVSDEE